MIRRVTDIDGPVQIRNAVLTVSDKKGLDVLAKGLVECCAGIQMFSTGGTYNHVRNALRDTPQLREVAEYTRKPETEGGLVKTLHHMLFLGYLTETYCDAHHQDLKRERAVPIDLVVCNLYPFREVVSKGGDIEDARGNIDVGGPSALRAAAKNWHRVAVLTDPSDYGPFLNELKVNRGACTLRTRFELHQKVFRMLGQYDTAIADYVEMVPFKEVAATYNIH